MYGTCGMIFELTFVRKWQFYTKSFQIRLETGFRGKSDFAVDPCGRSHSNAAKSDLLCPSLTPSFVNYVQKCQKSV